MGRAAQSAGREAEQLVEAALEWYQRIMWVGWWSHPGPRMRFFGRGRGRAKAVGPAPPDYVFFLGLDQVSPGHGCMLEVKRTRSKERVTLKDAAAHREYAQYRRMRKAHHEALAWAGYAVLWRPDAATWDWRYYPVQRVETTLFPPTVVLRRSVGMEMSVLEEAGPHAPDFLELMGAMSKS